MHAVSAQRSAFSAVYEIFDDTGTAVGVALLRVLATTRGQLCGRRISQATETVAHDVFGDEDAAASALACTAPCRKSGIPVRLRASGFWCMEWLLVVFVGVGFAALMLAEGLLFVMARRRLRTRGYRLP